MLPGKTRSITLLYLNFSPGFFMFALMDPANLAVYHPCIGIIPWFHSPKFRVAFFSVLFPVFIIVQRIHSFPVVFVASYPSLKPDMRYYNLRQFRDCSFTLSQLINIFYPTINSYAYQAAVKNWIGLYMKHLGL